MVSYSDRLKELERQADIHERELGYLVKETKRIYSTIKDLEGMINRIQSLTTLLIISRIGGAAVPAVTLEDIAKARVPLPDIITAETPPVPTFAMRKAAAEAAIAAGISPVMMLGIVTAIIPVVFQIATMVAARLDNIEREKRRIFLDKKLTEWRLDIFAMLDKNTAEEREHYRSLRPG